MQSGYKFDEKWDFLLALLNASGSAVVISDGTKSDQPILYTNSAFKNLTGYSAEEVLGKNCRFLQSTDRDQPERHLMAESIRKGKACECLIRNYTKTGKMFWNKIYIFPLYDDKEITFFVSFQYDSSAEQSLVETLRNTSRERSQLISELYKKRNKLEQLSVALINAQEVEREAVARELHDELGQRLSALIMLIHRAKLLYPVDSNREIWSEAEQELNHLVQLVRNMSASLRPAGLAAFGLEESIRYLLTRQIPRDVMWSFDFLYIGLRLIPAVEISLFRIVQESITNIVRYAKASHVIVRISVVKKTKKIKLTIRDDGVGFDCLNWREKNLKASKFGLYGMFERVQLLGGTFKIDSSVGKGTKVEATLPMYVVTSSEPDYIVCDRGKLGTKIR